MEKKLRIGLDFDDTLEELVNAWIGKMGLSSEPPVHLTKADWTKWSFNDLEPLHGRKLQAGIPLKDGRVTDGTEHFMTGPDDKTPGAISILEFLAPDLYENIQPIPGAPAAVAQLAKLPHTELLCISAHPPGISEAERLAFEAAKLKIIEARYPALKGKIHFASDKTQFDLDVLIDDGAHNIRKFLDAAEAKGRPVRALLVTTALNKSQEIEGADRIASISEAPSLIQQAFNLTPAKEEILYLSGPMTHCKSDPSMKEADSNYGSFNTLAAYLRSQGKNVVNPTNDEQPWTQEAMDPAAVNEKWRGFVRRDIATMLTSGATRIAFLPPAHTSLSTPEKPDLRAWHDSSGVCLETVLALKLGFSFSQATKNPDGTWTLTDLPAEEVRKTLSRSKTLADLQKDYAGPYLEQGAQTLTKPQENKMSEQAVVKTKIGFDFDDTLVPLFGPWISKMGAAAQPRLELGEKDWDNFYGLTTMNDKKVEGGLTLPSGRKTFGGEAFTIEIDEKSADKVLVHEFLSPDIYRETSATPFPGAREGVSQITALPGVSTVCVTAHALTVSNDPQDPERLAYEDVKKEVLKESFPALKEVIFTSDKTKLGLDVLIDDGAHNIRKFLAAKAAANEKGLGILINRNWNKNESIEELEGAVRVNNLPEAVAPIAQFIAERQAAFNNLRRVPVTTLDLPLPEKTKEAAR